MASGTDLTLFTLAIEGVDSDLSVALFEGTEGISELFAFQLDITSTDAGIEPDSAVGAKSTLTIATEGQTPRYVSGIVSRFELGEQTEKTAVYRATLVPSMFRLLYRHDSRIFQEKRVDEIIQEVFSDAGIDNFRLALHETYATREYCVQYRESDWAFLSRLMEEEGIFYFFEHEDGAHTLVMADTHSAHAPIPAPDKIPFRPPLGAMARGESISRFVFGRELRPGKVAMTDFNFKKPMLSLMSSASGDADADLEVYDYPGKFDLPDSGDAVAKVRLGEWEASRRWGGGDGGSARFAPGSLFELTEHPRGSANRAYLITRVHHQGVAPQMGDTRDITQSYRNRFEVIHDDVPFRPVRRTPRPAVRGVQTAIVTGPSGEEVYVDEHGRVKVQFHWDRKGKKDEKSSCWIRVSQAWAGAGWGGMIIPRVGHEVIVDFIEGDPDRPIITGRVYHGMNVPPYPLPAEKTKSSLRSSSSPGNNGSNEIRFEDKAGSEEIFLHGEKDWNIIIEHDKTQSIGNDEELTVGHDRKKKVARNQSEDVGKDKSINVGSNHIEVIGSNEAQTIGANATKTVGGAFIASIGAAASVSVGAAVTVNVGGKLAVGVGGDKEETVGAASAETVGADKKVDVAADYKVNVGGSMTKQIAVDDGINIGKNQNIEVGEKITIVCGDAKVTIEKNGDITVVGKEIKVEGSTKVIVQAGSKVKIQSDGPVEIEASAAMKLKGSAVNIN
jgi:type VI secretion system secreted protein VgrG